MDEQERWAYRRRPGVPSRGAAARARVAIDEQLGRTTESWIVELANEYNEAMQLTEDDLRQQAAVRRSRSGGRYRRFLRRLAG